MNENILLRKEGGLGRITLNRASALHALNLDMCQGMIEALNGWIHDDDVVSVLIDHAGDRGFCAGGDIRMLAESGRGDAKEAKRFFHTEYRLNELLMRYPKPVIAVIDGIVMGGGVGLSQPAPVRIATERTVYAMPETDIGFFPDVGGGWFLPRLPGQSGIWLALAGARLKASDCMALGIATHFLPTDCLSAFKLGLAAAPHSPGAVASQFSCSPGPASLADKLPMIDRIFAFNTVEDIFTALEKDGSTWSQSQLALLKRKSPQSMKVALRQTRAGAKHRSFAETMEMEYRLAGRIVRTHDFQEGVRAVIIDKDNAPAWSAQMITDVSEPDIDALFAPLPHGEAWTPLEDGGGN